MNLISKSVLIFLILLLLLSLVAMAPSNLTIGLFLIATTAILIYQVIIVLKDPSEPKENDSSI